MENREYKPLEEPERKVDKNGKSGLYYRGYKYIGYINAKVSIDQWLQLIDNAKSRGLKLHTYIKLAATHPKK